LRVLWRIDETYVRIGVSADNEEKQMATSFKDTLRAISGGAIAAAMFLSTVAGAAHAQTRTVVGEECQPTVWIDPDGWEH
jgi:hypothetical protein